MILYENSVSNFLKSVNNRNLVNFMVDEFYVRVSRKVTPVTKNNWKYTMEILKQIVESSGISDDCGIRIDYVMLERHNRFEIVFACEMNGNPDVLVLEMLPWENVHTSDQEDIVSYDEGDETDLQGVHPSYQSISYKKYLIRKQNEIIISSCVYLYDCIKEESTQKIIEASKKLIAEAPIYFSSESEKVEAVLARYKNGVNGKKVLNIFHQQDQLSTEGVDAFLSGILSDEDKNKLTEDQKFVMVSVIKKCEKASSTMFMVDGSPGTGKTMLALTCLIELQKQNYKVAYVTPTKVQCEMLKRKLKELSDEEFYIDVIPRFRMRQKKENITFDAVFVDEAQRLFSSMFVDEDISINLKTILGASNVVVCMYSSVQIMRGQIFDKSTFEKIAIENDKEFVFHNLNRNMRYAGKGSGISWLAHQFQIADTGNYEDWDSDVFDIHLVDKPQELVKKVKEINDSGKLSRVLVRYHKRNELCVDPNTGDEVYSMPQENFEIPICTTASGKVHRWCMNNDLVEYAAGPHVVQGLEFDHVGVIIGEELSFDDEAGEVIVRLKDNELSDNTHEVLTLIKQAYYILLSRAMNGVIIYCADSKLKKYLEEKLFYSSRRFSWIKELANQYGESEEKNFLEKQGSAKKSDYDYVLLVYEAVNDFIAEIKQFSEDQLDEEKFKVISDKCSDFLLKLQIDPMSKEEIQAKYREIIIVNMGQGAWDKLSDNGKKCLISAELTYHDMKDYNQLYDFSAVCVQVSKAVEYELTKRFYGEYVGFLEDLYQKDENPNEFMENVPGVIKKEEKRKTRLLKEQEVTLGTIPFIVGISIDSVVTDLDAFKSFSRYAEAKLLNTKGDIQSILAKHIKYIVRIKNDYRNKAAHKNPMDVVSARACLDYVIEVQRTLGQMLDDYCN